MSTAQQPPGPKGGLFGLDNVAHFKREPLHFLMSMAREYGDIVHFRFGPHQVYQPHTPELVREILVNQADKFHKWQLQKKVMGKVLGNGIFLSDDDVWKRQRKLVAPALHTKRIQHYAEIMTLYTNRLVDSWQPGQEIDIAEEMLKVTMDIVAKSMFDADGVSAEAQKLSNALRVVQDMIIREMTALIMPVPDWVPTPRNLRENQAMADLDEVVMDFIHKKRANTEDRGDLLSMLMQAVDDETGEPMNDEQVREEVITLFTAGYDTTALALAWAFYLLSLNRDVEERLVAEVKSVLGGRTPTLEDLQTMNYTDRVLKETMRLYPPAPFFPREAIADVEIGGYTLPKGSVVFISPYVIHRDPEFFPDPERFEPERFNPGYEERIPKYAYFPFGGGPRVCIGQSFALMEAEIILATIVQRFHLALVPGQDIIPEPTITLHAKHGIQLRIVER